MLNSINSVKCSEDESTKRKQMNLILFLKRDENGRRIARLCAITLKSHRAREKSHHNDHGGRSSRKKKGRRRSAAERVASKRMHEQNKEIMADNVNLFHFSEVRSAAARLR